MSEKLVANLTYNNTLQLTTQLLKNDPVFLNTKLHCKGNRKKEKKIEETVYYLNSEFIKSVLIFLTSNQQPIFRLID